MGSRLHLQLYSGVDEIYPMLLEGLLCWLKRQGCFVCTVLKNVDSPAGSLSMCGTDCRSGLPGNAHFRWTPS